MEFQSLSHPQESTQFCWKKGEKVKTKQTLLNHPNLTKKRYFLVGGLDSEFLKQILREFQRKLHLFFQSGKENVEETQPNKN